MTIPTEPCPPGFDRDEFSGKCVENFVGEGTGGGWQSRESSRLSRGLLRTVPPPRRSYRSICPAGRSFSITLRAAIFELGVSPMTANIACPGGMAYVQIGNRLLAHTMDGATTEIPIPPPLAEDAAERRPPPGRQPLLSVVCEPVDGWPGPTRPRPVSPAGTRVGRGHDRSPDGLPLADPRSWRPNPGTSLHGGPRGQRGRVPPPHRCAGGRRPDRQLRGDQRLSNRASPAAPHRRGTLSTAGRWSAGARSGRSGAAGR